MKKLLVIMLCLTVLITMTACGNTGGTKPSNNAPDAAKSAKKIDFPKKEITLVVPWNPGGTNDLMARVLQPVFMKKFNVNLVVKNSAGGGSAVGITEVLTARNDGYTVGLASSSFLALVAQGRMKADVDKIENICMVAEEPIVLVAKSGGKYDSAKALIAAAKANPEKVSIGTPGTNNINQAYPVLLGKAADCKFLFMPFDGGSRVVTEILGGHVDAGTLKPSEVLTQVKSGDLKILGVFNKNGLKTMPDVPTFESLGYDVFTIGQLKQVSYVMAPAGLDPQVKALLGDMFKQALQSDEFIAFAAESGMISEPITGDALNASIKDIFTSLQKASKDIFTK